MAEESFNQLYSRYNTDDVFNRVIIIGLLDLLNHKMSYEQIWDDNVVEQVYVPFMYDFGSSDERFAQDNYAFFGTSCFSEKKITGKFDMLPRGAIKYTGSSIDAANITNRFVKGTYMKNENGKLTSYTSFLYSLPLTFNFECEMWIDNIVTAFKIEQAIRETFYKNKTYYVLYKGMKLSCCAGFPETANLEKTVSYSFDQERQIKLTFSLAVEAYQPVFDESLAVESSKRIEHIAFDVEMLHSPLKRIQNIKLKPIPEGSKYPYGTAIRLDWTSTSTVSDMCTIGISYVDSNNEEHIIDIVPYNQRSYIWTIPHTLSNFDQPTIIFNDQDLVITEPDIKVIPGVNGDITEESFIVVDPGKFSINNGEMPATVEYVKEDGSVELSESYTFNIVDGKISHDSPVKLNGSLLSYGKTMKYNEVSFKVYYPLDKSVFDETAKVLII